MADPGQPSPGEWAGIVGGVVGGLIALGHGIRWLFNWNDARAASRAAKLQAWHEELAAREKQFDERIDARLKQLEAQNAALRIAFELVAAPLRAVDPGNDKLHRAEQILAAAFGLDPLSPDDMQASLTKLG